MIPEGQTESTWHYRTSAATREKAVEAYVRQDGQHGDYNSIIEHFKNGGSGIVLCTPCLSSGSPPASHPAYYTTLHRVVVESQPRTVITPIK